MDSVAKMDSALGFPALPPLVLLQARHCAVLCDSPTGESHAVAMLFTFLERNMHQFAMATDLPQEPQYVCLSNNSKKLFERNTSIIGRPQCFGKREGLLSPFYVQASSGTKQ